MNAIYINVNATQSIFDLVTKINGSSITPTPLNILAQTNGRFCYNEFGYSTGIIVCSDESITSLDMQDVNATPYNPTVAAFIGGRPPHPPTGGR